MRIGIITDSTADLSLQLAKQLGITVVPAYIHFGTKTYRDQVDISEDEFYYKLMHEPEHPTTDPPTPEDFAEVYQNLSRQSDGIVSIHISRKLSATYNSALRGRELANVKCRIEVIDSQLVTMGLGLLAIIARSTAKPGNTLNAIVEETRRAILDIRMVGLFDTLNYLVLGGRISKAKAWLGSMLNAKPILTMRNGEIEPLGQAFSRKSGLSRLIEFVENAGDINDLAIVYSTTPDEAETLAGNLSSIFARKHIRLARMGPTLGVHGGPGILFVVLRKASHS